MKRGAAFAALLLILLVTAPAGAATLVGGAQVLPTTDNNPAGTAEAFRVAATATGTVAKISVYVDATSTAATIVTGLYTDSASHPAALLGQGTLTNPVTGAWNDVAIAASPVTAGANYWIAILGPAGGNRPAFRDNCCGGANGLAEVSTQTTLTTLPASWSTGGSYRDGPLAAYGSSIDGPALQVAPAALSFTGAIGSADPAAKQLAITNAGGGALTWTAAGSAPWLTVTPPSGSAPGNVAVSVSGNGLAAGTYTGQVTITAPSATGSPASIPVTFTVAAAPDTTPPITAITAPADGASVSGTVTVAAVATDTVGVTGVQFTLDGAALGTEDTTSPYGVTWNTTSVANGAHTLRSVARDAAGNQATSPAVTVTVANSAPPPATGLVAAWGFNEGSGTTAADGSGAGHTGTLTSTTWTATGKYGGALSFNGGSSWVTVPDADDLDLSGAMTLEAWVNPATLGSIWRSVVVKEAPGYFRYALYANTDTGGPSGHVFVGADLSARGSTRLPTGTWTHVAAVYDGTRVRLYVNGVETANASATGTMTASTGVLRIGGNAIWNEWFSGQIDEVRVYSRALSAGEIQTDMNTPVGAGGPPPSDTTPPTVAVTAPATGATVASTTSVAANATDNVGVVGVQFRLDGANLGTEDTTAPYSVSWNTTQAIEGTHTLTAVARDAAGNTSTSPAVTVTVQNGGPASQVGQWSAVEQWPIVAVHTTLLPNGEVLAFDAWDHAPNTQRIWDPVLDAFVTVPYARNLFCGGHTSLGDGRLIVIGGNVEAYVGLADTTLFDATNNTWTRGADMARTRWYPTATTLPDGRVLAISGDQINRGTLLGRLYDSSNTLPEIYNPTTNTWSQLTSAQREVRLYPFMFVLPDGRVLDAGPSTQSQILNLQTGTWSAGPVSQIDGHSAVMYRPGKILKSGTAADPDFPNLAVTNRTVVVDMTAADPAWREVGPMAYQRSYQTLTVLPDGKVLAIGGGTTSDGVRQDTAVKAAEIWDPATETWATMASSSERACTTRRPPAARRPRARRRRRSIPGLGRGGRGLGGDLLPAVPVQGRASDDHRRRRRPPRIDVHRHHPGRRRHRLRRPGSHGLGHAQHRHEPALRPAAVHEGGGDAQRAGPRRRQRRAARHVHAVHRRRQRRPVRRSDGPAPPCERRHDAAHGVG